MLPSILVVPFRVRIVTCGLLHELRITAFWRATTAHRRTVNAVILTFSSATSILLAVLAAGSILLPGARAATIVQWTFETNTPADLPNTAAIGPIAADLGTGQASGLHASASTDWTTPAGNGSSNSLSSNEWAIGDYYQFALSLTGFQDITLTWDQTRSNTGPATFDLAYSLNGTDFTVASDNYDVPPQTWSALTPNPGSGFTVNLSTVNALNNASSVIFRLVADSDPGGTAGTNRIDNFTVNGNTFVPPAPILYWDANGASAGVGGVGSWTNSGATWTPDVSGASGLQPFDPANRAVFAGTAGTVTIDPAGVQANAGIRFEVDGYQISGGRMTLGATSATIEVTNAADTATISSVIGGTSGFVKIGNGTLVLQSAASEFTGNVAVNAGKLSISDDGQLGASANDVILGGGTLRPTTTMSLNASRDLSGIGSIEIPATTIVSVLGNVAVDQLSVQGTGTLRLRGTTADLGTLTIAGAGAVEVDGAATTASGVVFSEAGTLRNVAGGLALAGGVSVTATSGTSTIAGPVDLGAANRTFTVADGAAAVDLAVTGPLTLGSGGKLQKFGPGTLELSGQNTAFAGVRHGAAGNSPTFGGTIRITNKDALGNGEYQFNAGTLEVATALTGANALPLSVGISVGANVSIPAIFTGAALEVTGTTSLFKPTSGNFQHQITVDNDLVLTGPLGASNGTGASTGVTFAGSGSITLNHAANTIVEPITVNGPMIAVNGSLSAPSVAVRSGTLKGTGTLEGALEVGESTAAPGILAPGLGIGTLSAASLILQANAVFQLEISTGQRTTDVLKINGLTELGAELAMLQVIDLNPVLLPAGVEFLFLQNDSTSATTGLFNALPDGAVFFAGANLFAIDYGVGVGGNDVLLRVVPEPGSLLLLICGAAAFGCGRQRSGRTIPDVNVRGRSPREALRADNRRAQSSAPQFPARL